MIYEIEKYKEMEFIDLEQYECKMWADYNKRISYHQRRVNMLIKERDKWNDQINKRFYI